jgi:transposase
MSLHPQELPPIPEETRRLARAAFPRGNVSRRLRDERSAISDDPRCAPLFPPRGQPAASPWRLAVTTVMPCAEGVSDRPAADAGRSRSDWKEVLRLELTDPGGDHTVLSEVRTRRVAGPADQRRLDTLLARGRAASCQSAAASAPTPPRCGQRCGS